jgi:hypothetical protein
MIDAKELMIWNVVILNNPFIHQQFTGRYFEVIGFTKREQDYSVHIKLLNPVDAEEELLGDINQSSDNIDPVPITPEILEAVGFVEFKMNRPLLPWDFANEKHSLYEHSDGGYMFMPFNTDNEEAYQHVRYLHELQNIIYWNEKRHLNVDKLLGK